ncbi:MAG: hypothetical protein FWF28_10595, partial [Micrococcales bacterium]|nr:hypothetical protein [Micrococcales bacterium]
DERVVRVPSGSVVVPLDDDEGSSGGAVSSGGVDSSGAKGSSGAAASSGGVGSSDAHATGSSDHRMTLAPESVLVLRLAAA